jgi:hypothetical protein
VKASDGHAVWTVVAVVNGRAGQAFNLSMMASNCSAICLA